MIYPSPVNEPMAWLSFAGWQRRIHSRTPLQISLSRTPRSPAFAFICLPRSGIHAFDLVMTTSLKLKVIFFLGEILVYTDLLLSTTWATLPILISVYVYEFRVTLITENQVLAQPKLGIRSG